MGVAEADIDDLLQEVLLATYRTLDRFDPDWAPPESEAGDLARWHARRQHRSAEERWVFGIAWRKVGHYLERAYRRREVSHGLLPASCSEAVDPAPLSEQRAVERERLELVIDVLWTLAPERRLLLVLHEAYEVPLVEIARELGINYNTATNRLRLAREDYRAAVKRLRPEQRDALRGCWLGLPLASELLVREGGGAIAPASCEISPPAAPAERALPASSSPPALPPPASSPPALPASSSPPALPPPASSPPALPASSSPPALPPPASSPPALPASSSPPALRPPASSPPAPGPMGATRVRPWLGELGRALGWSAVGAGGALGLLFALAPPRPLWADRFGPPVEALSAVTALAAARSAPVEMTPQAMPEPQPPQPVSPAPDAVLRRGVAPRPAPAAGARKDSFVEEYRLLDAAQVAFSAGDTVAALRHVALHEQRFPSGQLRSVRERLRELALARLARSAEGAAKKEPSR
ncbi:sigma factor-like helix-turn-helix DNA-binding protein [Sorangium sp. So ce513]|uniref:RNA polymerase sigma factor n=1 Tax=Sorangium sp. So ce513 TaxID=3133315 RepID=UPI003F601BC7